MDSSNQYFEKNTVELERGRIRLFAEVIGDVDPKYHDLEHARRLGYPDLMVPPTMYAGLELQTGHAVRTLDALGIDSRFVLHAQQSFEYLSPSFAGDELVMSSHLQSTWEKKDGLLLFVARQIELTVDDRLVGTMQSVAVEQRERRDREHNNG